MFNEKRAGGFYRGKLEFFFGAEVGEEARLAHFQIFSEAADGEAFEAVYGGEIYGAAEDGFAGAEAAGLATRGEFGFAGVANGLRRHGRSLTRNK